MIGEAILLELAFGPTNPSRLEVIPFHSSFFKLHNCSFTGFYNQDSEGLAALGSKPLCCHINLYLTLSTWCDDWAYYGGGSVHILTLKIRVFTHDIGVYSKSDILSM